MKKIEKLNLEVTETSSIAIFDDPRQDVRTLMNCLNTLSKKIDELIDNINNLNKRLEESKK